MSIEIGLKGHAEATVSFKDTASAVGSGLVPVFSTPSMAALMEQACVVSLTEHLEEGQGSVGVHLDISHDAASPMGMNVRAESEVTEVDGKFITFAVSAYDEVGPIGHGTHKRALVTIDRFLEKVSNKKA